MFDTFICGLESDFESIEVGKSRSYQVVFFELYQLIKIISQSSLTGFVLRQ